MNRQNKKGFTLLEILLVVAAIAILAGVVIVAINPGKQLADTRNAQRRVDVNTILNATYQYAIDNKGVIPGSITASATEICKTGSTCTGIDMSALTLNELYLTAIPTDPSGGTTNGTGYFIAKTANGRITVSAPSAERSVVINATK